MNVVIPAAGLGTRFNTTIPKPLLDVNGSPMLARVINNFYHYDAKFFVCVLKEHQQKFNIIDNVKDHCDESNITYVIIDELTDGPARTSYFAKQYLNVDDPLIVTNCDQVIFDLDVDRLSLFAGKNSADGVLGTFYSNSPKNSYVRLNDDGLVTQVKEKEVISNYATNGLHFWTKGSYFFDSCDEMFSRNDRVNNEFYVGPSYNYMINKGKKVIHYFFNEHFPIGIPQDLEKFKKIDENL
jgi:NDP-sugar pyrophosphorylase family protein